jgi:hypothetical protein
MHLTCGCLRMGREELHAHVSPVWFTRMHTFAYLGMLSFRKIVLYVCIFMPRVLAHTDIEQQIRKRFFGVNLFTFSCGHRYCWKILVFKEADRQTS